MLKKIFIGLLVLILLLLGTAIALPFIFKDDLIKAVRDQANENLNATVDFSDVSLSLFRHFPSISLGIDDLSVIGQQQFEGIPLIKANRFDLALDFWSVVGGGDPLKINGVYLDRPEINVHVLKDGTANYNITKDTGAPETTSTESSGFVINLDHYEINDGIIVYDDKSLDFLFKAEEMNHSGSGNFTASVFDLDTKTKVKYLTLGYGGIAYLSNVKTDLDAIFNIDLDNSKYTLKDNDLVLNALHILADGWIQMKEEDIDMDLSFKAPSNSFGELFSIIPQAYMEGYENVKVDGSFSLDGFVKGTYNGERDVMPAFGFKINVDNGNVQYPGAPIGISAINAKMDVNSPSSDLNKMVLDIPTFNLKLGSEPFKGRFNLKTPLTDPDIDTEVKGMINLDNLAKAMPMDGIQQMGGLIDADFAVKARLSQMESGNYDQINAKGYLNFKDFVYQASGMPAVKIATLNTDISPRAILLSNLNMKMGKSDLSGNGSVQNYLAYFSPEKTMEGTFDLKARQLDLNEWMSETPANANASPVDTSSEELFDRFKISLKGQADIVEYDTYKLLNTNLDGTVSPDHIVIRDFSTNIGKNDIAASGDVKNIFNYLFENETLRGDLNLRSNYLNLNELMGETPEGQEGSTSTESTGPVMVPENMDINVNADLKQVIYSNITLNNVSGALKVANERVSLKNVTADGLGGKMAMSGGYDTSNPDEPKFALKYDLSRLSFQEAFSTVNTFEKLAPIGKFIRGNFTSNMSMEGTLDQDMTPKFTNLNAEGFLATINGVLKGFKPLEKVAGLLKMDAFNTLEIADMKTWFEIKDGKVNVEEFPVKAANIDMKVKGSHSLTQEMDYLIKAKVPKNLLGNNVLSNSLGSGMSALSEQAGKLGIDISNSPFINLGINLTGSISDPKVKISLLGADGEPSNLVDEAKEKIKEEVDKKVEEVKEEIKEEIDNTKEDLKAKADAEIAKLMDEARKTAETVKTKGYQLAEDAKKLGYDQAAKLEKEAGNNPLKKAGAKIAADKLRKETDAKVAKMKKEADQQADKVIKEAEIQAEKIRQKYQNQ
jgi:hypothetical protein